MKTLKLLILFALLFPGIACAAGWKEIAPKRVYDLLKEGSGLWLIDLRSSASFERAHIEGAVNIPEGVLATKTFPPQKMLVLVDNALGNLRAREAAQKLAAKGNKRVFVLAGGLHGWKRAGLHLVGDETGFELARLNPGDLLPARGKVAMEIYDLRGEEESAQGAIDGSFTLPGGSLDEKLAHLRGLLEKKGRGGLAAELKEPEPVVVVLPLAADARSLYQRYLWNLAGEVRVLEGGHAAWNARRGKVTISNMDGCATCPGAQ